MTDKPAEKTYYQGGQVTITSTRAVFWSNTYALANITSVSALAVPASALVPFLLVGGGVLAILFGVVSPDNQLACWGIGAVLVVAGVLYGRAQKPAYVVKIGTAGAEQRAYTSQDKDEIDRIVAALNEAIVQRG